MLKRPDEETDCDRKEITNEITNETVIELRY